MRTESPMSTSGRRRALAGLLGIVAVLTLVLSACDVPDSSAGTLFDAWKSNNPTKAHTVATNTAVSQIFARAYKAADDWIFVRCDGAAGSTYCTWVNIVETRLQTRTVNQTKKVTEALYIPLGEGASGHFFHDWRRNNSANAAHYGTSGAIHDLFTMTYHAGDHWQPQSCEGAAGSIYCTWRDDRLDTIVTRYDNVSAHKVISVAYTAHA